jgi:hypothetical protein
VSGFAVHFHAADETPYARASTLLTSLALGLDVPPTLLARTDEVIE